MYAQVWALEMTSGTFGKQIVTSNVTSQTQRQRAHSSLKEPRNTERLTALRRDSLECCAGRELPGGGYWMSPEALKYDVTLGKDFVLQRPKRDGPGLMMARKDTKLNTTQKAESTQLAVCGKGSSRNLVSRNSSPWSVTDITDYTFLGDSRLLPGANAPILLPALASSLHQAGKSCTGIILHPAIERTALQVRFTCKLCNTTSEKRVSPLGWNSGTVFARCEGCSVVHKLIDNLNIIHDLKGAVFPKPLPKNLKIPPGLPQNPQLDYHRHPALYKEFPEG